MTLQDLLTSDQISLLRAAAPKSEPHKQASRTAANDDKLYVEIDPRELPAEWRSPEPFISAYSPRQ